MKHKTEIEFKFSTGDYCLYLSCDRIFLVRIIKHVAEWSGTRTPRIYYDVSLGKWGSRCVEEHDKDGQLFNIDEKEKCLEAFINGIEKTINPKKAMLAAINKEKGKQNEINS